MTFLFNLGVRVDPEVLNATFLAVREGPCVGGGGMEGEEGENVLGERVGVIEGLVCESVEVGEGLGRAEDSMPEEGCVVGL
eukprot:682173-Amorphochlora_amoeboformis.AAC.1